MFYSKDFIKVMDPILLILSGPLDSLSLVSDDLLLWTIERTFTKWGKAVRTDVTSAEFPTIALDTPTGCAQLLTTMLIADLTLLTGESLFLQERFYRAAIAAQVQISTSGKPTKPNAEIDREKSPLNSGNCRFHMAYLLNAKLLSGNKISPCKKGKDCHCSHVALNAITKAAALSLADKFNPKLKESVIERIEELSNKFKK